MALLVKILKKSVFGNLKLKLEIERKKVQVAIKLEFCGGGGKAFNSPAIKKLFYFLRRFWLIYQKTFHKSTFLGYVFVTST